MGRDPGLNPPALNRSDEAGQLRVLHVDDEREVAELTSGYLQRHFEDLEVVIETDVAAALDTLGETPIDCVVSDYEMPGRDGLSFLEAVRDEHPDLPFILFTGKGSEEIASEAISRGVTDYLQKGTRSEQYELLANRVQNAVEQAMVRAERDRTQARFTALTQNASFAVITIDEGSTIHYVNDAIEDVLGYEPHQLRGDSLLKLVPDRFQEDHLEALERYVEERTPNLDWSWTELPGVHADGHEVPLGISFNVMQRDGGLLFTGIIRDISEKQERERELERYETLLETVTDGVYALDTAGRYTYVNEWITERTGYDREELLGEAPTMLIQADAVERFEDGIREMLSGERNTFSTELTATATTGETFPCEAKITTLTVDGEFDGTVGVVRDISERKERERELERQNERLDEFASVVSHDLRGPLGVAKGRLELAAEEFDSEDLTAASDELERMERLMEDLLELSRNGQLVEAFEPADLAAVFEDSWDRVAGDGDLRIDVGDATVAVDRDRTVQALENLLENAVDHAGPEPTIRVGLLDEGDGFYVADDGPGVPPDEREAVFDRGYTTSKRGTGFGLSIVERILEAHDWEIRVTESDTGGARFEIGDVDLQ
jgi:PAS domain S-box-containing protein